MPNKSATVRLLTAAAGVMLLVTGCSTVSDTSSTTAAAPRTTSAAAAPGSGPEQSTAAVAGLAAAQQVVDRYSAVPSEIGLTQPLPTRPTGKTVYFMFAGIPQQKTYFEAAGEAGAALGMNVVTVDMGTSPETVAAAWTRAAQERPDAVISAGFPPSLYTDQLNTLAAENIPVVLWAINDGPAQYPGITATLNDEGGRAASLAGDITAAFAAVDSKGTANMGFFWVPDFPFMEAEKTSMQSKLSEYCGGGCHFTDETVPGSAFADNSIPGRVVSFLQAHPDTTWLSFSTSAMLAGVPQALDAAGLKDKVKLATIGSDSLTWQLLKDGSIAMVIGFPQELEVWAGFDTIARALAGSDITEAKQWLAPVQILTADNLTFDTTRDDYPGVPNFKDSFNKLWATTP